MPFISRNQIDQMMRFSFEETYKEKLKNALLDPLLTEDKKKEIHHKLEVLRLGVGKEYKKDSPIPVGAVSLD